MEYACAVEMGATGTSYTFLTTETFMCVQIIYGGFILHISDNLVFFN